jgi:hypothetical protein
MTVYAHPKEHQNFLNPKEDPDVNFTGKSTNVDSKEIHKCSPKGKTHK